MKRSFLPVVVFIFTAVCSRAQTQNWSAALPDDVKVAIAKSNAIYFSAFEKGDSSIFIDRYATDACIMAPGVPAMCGENTALDFFRIAYYNLGLRNGRFITKEIYGNEDYVTESGLWESLDANNKLMDNGKYLVLWKKTKKGWKMFRDSFSSDRPGN